MQAPFFGALHALTIDDGGGGAGFSLTDRRVVPLASGAARLMRAYSVQVETLRRLRHGGDQHVRVEHVHIGDGGQAIIGNVRKDNRHGGPHPGGAAPQDPSVDGPSG
jgi:hypothetical protein